MNTITKKDKADFNAARKAIFSLMRDQKWHAAQEIIDESGQREGLRRMRELRQSKAVEAIMKRRTAEDSREFEYKMILDDEDKE